MRSRPTALIGLALALAVGLSGCGGSGSAISNKSTEQVLALAKQKFDAAASVHMTLSTGSVPSQGDGVLGADGTLTHQPAFTGKVKVLLNGFNADIPVVSVGGKVYAKLPFTSRFDVIRPADYSAPDPADFVDPAHGLSALLLKLEDPKKAGDVRDGSTVLTSYTGSLAGTDVSPIIPSANESSMYTTVIGIDPDGRVITLKVTGDFFSGSGQVTYDVRFTDYGKNVKISAP